MRLRSKTMKHDIDDLSPLEEADPLKNKRMGDRPDKPIRRGPPLWPKVLLGLLVAVVLLVALLPRIASMEPVRRMVLEKVNAKIAPATLSIDDWSLRWFAPMSVSGIQFNDPRKKADLQIVKITTSGGLVGMLPIGRVSAGTITVDAPQTTMTLPTRQEKETAEANELEPPHGVKTKPALPKFDIEARLVIQGGSVKITGGENPFSLEHIALDIGLKSLDEPVDIKFAAFVPWKDDAGKLFAEGSVPSPKALLGGDAVSTERLALGVVALDLQSFRALLETLTGQPWIHSGVANGKISLTYRGLKSVQMKADMTVANLSVEPPGQMASPAGDVRVLADMDMTDGLLKINQCQCASPWVDGTIVGQLTIEPDDNGRRAMAIEALVDANLVTITRDFGVLLKMRTDCRAEQGHMLAQGSLTATADGVDAKVNLTTTNLTLRLDQNLYVPQPAPVVRLDMTKPYSGLPEIRDLQVILPFSHVSGKGRIENSAFKADVDLLGGSRLARQILTTFPVMVRGRKGELTSTQDGDTITITSAVSADDVAVGIRSGGRMAIQKGRLTASGKLPFVNGEPVMQVSEVNIAIESDAGTITATAEQIAPPTTNRPLVIVGGQAKADFDFAALRHMVGALLPLPTNAVFKGHFVAGITAEAAGGAAKVRVNAAAQDVQLTTTAWDIRENDMRMKMSADADLVKNEIRIFDTHVNSRVVNMTLPEWLVQLPHDDVGFSMNGTLMGDLSVATVSAWQRVDREGRQPPQMEGRVTFAAAGDSAKQNTTVSLNVALDQFRVVVATNKPFEDAHSELAVKTSFPADLNRVRLEKFALSNSLFSTSCQGLFDDPKHSKVLTLSGTTTVDYGNIDKWLRAQGVKYPVLAGRQTRPFNLSGSLAGGVQSFLSYGVASAATHFDSASAFGVAASNGEATVVLTNGVLNVACDPAVNQGKFRLNSSIEATATPMLLSMPTNTHMLQDVRLTQEMLDQMLVLMVPLLKGNQVLGGSVDLTLAECHVPLGPTIKQDTTFSAALQLKDVKLQPAGTLASILKLAGMGGEPVSIPRHQMTAVCKDGRVTPSPLQLKIAGTTVTLTGSVGLDSSLAFTAVVPVSKSLVGRNGEILRVPITGTIQNPAVDHKALEAEIARLAREAFKNNAKEKLGSLLKELKH